MIKCHAFPCRDPGAESATLAFCPRHLAMLTPHKRAKVVMVRGLNVLDIAFRYQVIRVANPDERKRRRHWRVNNFVYRVTKYVPDVK